MTTFSRLLQHLADLFLKRGMFQIESVETIKTHILCSTPFFFSSENRTVYEIMSKNVVEPDVTKYDKMWHAR